MDVDTALLRTWCVLAEEQHTGRAADRLQITQQAVSKRLARLEQQFGSALFERDGRRLRPTRLGTELLPLAMELVGGTDRLFSRVRPERCELRIDVLDEHLALTGPAAGYAARSKLPVAIVTRGDARTVHQVLGSGYADIAFGRASSFAERTAPRMALAGPVLEPIMVLVSERHRLATATEVGLSDLRDLPLWFPMTGAPREWRNLVEELTQTAGIELDPAGSTMGLSRFFDRLAGSPERISLYGAGMGAPPPGLRLLPITDPIPAFGWLAGWLPGGDRVQRRAAESVIARARRAIAEPHLDDAWLPEVDRGLIESITTARSARTG